MGGTVPERAGEEGGSSKLCSEPSRHSELARGGGCNTSQIFTHFPCRAVRGRRASPQARGHFQIYFML